MLARQVLKLDNLGKHIMSGFLCCRGEYPDL
jgi:hypothetical protein